MLKCEKIMDKVFEYVSVRDSVEKALKLIMEEKVNSIPVVEDLLTKKFVGQITNNDILLKVFAAGKEPHEVRVESVMTKQSVVCGVETSVNDALLLMLKEESLSIPIVDDQNSLVGTLTANHLSDTHELKFSWSRLLDSADEKLFESNFERNREAYEKRIDMELANTLSFIDVLQLKSRVEASGNGSKSKYATIFSQIEFLRKELEKSHQNMKLAKEKNWYLMRDEFEVARLKLNKKLFEFRESLSQLIGSQNDVSKEANHVF